jgi:hypothetical protein
MKNHSAELRELRLKVSHQSHHSHPGENSGHWPAPGRLSGKKQRGEARYER